MLKLIKKFAWVAIALLLIAVFFASIATEKKPAQTTLNEIAAKITAGEVKKIELTDNTLSAELQNGETVSATKETSAGVVETLKNYGVEAEQLRNVPFEVKDSSASSVFWSVIVPTMLPIIAIAVLFLFFIRKATAGANQALTFGNQTSGFSPT
jgi:ATP-dependent Zn protease